MESTENNVKTDVVMRYPKGRDKNKRAQAVFFEVQSDMEGGAYLKRKVKDYKGKTWGCIEVDKFDEITGEDVPISKWIECVYKDVSRQLDNETRRHIPIKKNILIIPKSKPEKHWFDCPACGNPIQNYNDHKYKCKRRVKK